MLMYAQTLIPLRLTKLADGEDSCQVRLLWDCGGLVVYLPLIRQSSVQTGPDPQIQDSSVSPQPGLQHPSSLAYQHELPAVSHAHPGTLSHHHDGRLVNTRVQRHRKME